MLDIWNFIIYSFTIVFLGVFLNTQWMALENWGKNELVLVNSEKTLSDFTVLPEVKFLNYGLKWLQQPHGGLEYRNLEACTSKTIY